MTIADLLRNSKIQSLESECVVAHIFAKDRSWVLAHSDHVVKPIKLQEYDQFQKRILDHEPLALVLGHQEFYGRSFAVNAHTLIPRASTETLIDETLRLLKTDEDRIIEPDTQISVLSAHWGNLHDVHTIVDIGTGSGCIAITLACQLPTIKCIATDISTDALQVAQSNAHTLGVSDRVSFVSGSLLEPVADLRTPFLLVSNPPYIPSEILLDASVMNFEPHTALFAGKDGMDILRPLLHSARAYPYCRGCVIECRNDQVKEILQLLH